MSRWAWAEIDAAAIEHNVAAIVAEVAPAQVWTVVKANGYGHGAVLVAQAALRGGATGLCVALVQEAAELRAASAIVRGEQGSDPASVAHRAVAQATTQTRMSRRGGTSTTPTRC